MKQFLLTVAILSLLMVGLYTLKFTHYNTTISITHTEEGTVVGNQYSCTLGVLILRDGGNVLNDKGKPIKCSHSEKVTREEAAKRGY